MRVLGIDPGTRNTGWGVVERRGSKMVAVASGTLRLDTDAPLADRLEHAYTFVGELIDTHRPNAVAVEDVFYAKYANAAIKLGHMRGVVLLLTAQRGLELGEYPPALVKRTVAGRGAADKAQIGKMVRAILGFDGEASTDATDALALGITHLSAVRQRA